MKFIGVTGGIGAGKSEILKFIAKHYDCEVYFADDVAFEVRKKGTECYNKLAALLGEDVASDRQKMAKAVFADKELLEKVNAIIHPAVKDYLLDALNRAKEKGCELFFVEAALLIEAGYKEILDELWYVYADREVRVKRLMESRGYSREKAEGIMANQLTDEVFRRECDFIIDNSSSLDKAYEDIKRRLEGYRWQE